MTESKPTMYLALTSENPRLLGWSILAVASNRQTAEQEGIAELERQYGPLGRRLQGVGDPDGRPGWFDPSTFARVAYANLVVVSRSVARRQFGVGDAAYQVWLGMDP